MPKNGSDDDMLEFNLRKTKGESTDANPLDENGDSIFDDLNPRFVQQLDEAVDKATKKPTPKTKDLDDDLDPSDDEFKDEIARDDAADDEDEDDARDQSDEKDEAEDPDAVDEDADEPRHGRKPSKFERRIARAERITDEIRQQNAELVARLNERDQTDKTAASEAEYTTFKGTTESKLKTLKAEKKIAVDEGNTDAQVDIDEQMIQLNAELIARTQAHEAAKKSIEKAASARRVSPITALKVTQWKRRNQRYETDPVFRATVNDLDAKLASSGSDPESDDHYEKLDRELKKLFPAKSVRTRRHPSSQTPGEGSPGVRRKSKDTAVTVKDGKIRISPEKLRRVQANMSRFGLDPNSRQDVADYIQNNKGSI